MRHSMSTRWLPAFVCAILALGTDAQTPSQQSLLEENRALRDELEQTRSRVIAMEEEVSRLLSERQRLESSLARAENLLASLRRLIAVEEAPIPRVRTAPLPEDPLASPASLLREMRSQYNAHMLGIPMDEDAEREAYIQRAQHWQRTTNRKLRGIRTWLVTLDDIEPVGASDYVVRMTVLDPETRLPIGDPFDTEFPKRFMDAYERGTKTGMWEVTGLVVADPVFNEDRLEPGVFEFPTLVGPMIEFDFDLAWQGFRAYAEAPAPAEAEAETDQEADPEPDAEEDSPSEASPDDADAGNENG